MNPLLPNLTFLSDVEARQWNDGRLYVYGSQDLLNGDSYCSKEYHVYSTDNLKDWVDHGVSLSSDQILYAPDCIYKNGLYYLYYCTAGNGEYVATSASPSGPFTDSKEIAVANGDSIDPAVFTDDDGQAYYFWGQFHLRGAKLSADMSHLESVQDHILTEEEHGFHEGASIRKRRGIYYLIYTDITRYRATCLSYATSKSPLGPYTKRGVMIDNYGCDPAVWNNHGSIFEFQGQWYVAYHRACFGSFHKRRFCVEPIRFDENGYIAEVGMTTNGADRPIDAAQTIEACRAAYINGKAASKLIGGREVLAGFKRDDWLLYQSLDFTGGETAFELEFERAQGSFEIEIKAGAFLNTDTCGVLQIHGGDIKAACRVRTRKGVNRLFLRVSAADSESAGLNLIRFRFKR